MVSVLRLYGGKRKRPAGVDGGKKSRFLGTQVTACIRVFRVPSGLISCVCQNAGGIGKRRKEIVYKR